MSDAFSRARQLFLDGVAAYEAGRLADAEARFEASLAALPGRPSTLVNLAATRIRLGRPADALPLLDEALAAVPDDVDAWRQREAACAALRRPADTLAALERVTAIAPDDAVAWLRRGQLLQQLDRAGDALAATDRAIELDASSHAAWTQRGNLVKELGRRDDALDAYRRAIELGADAALHRYYLAALGDGAAPTAPPADYVERLFDDYADSFDAHLVGALGYRAPERLVAPLRARRFRAALDLGCGTGLCGPLLRPLADRLHGVDLSATMLAKARALAVYDRLDRAELVAHLATTPHRYELVLAADVFIYVGALDAVFRGVQRVLEPGGLFSFSVEHAADDVDFELRPSLRYAHSQRYLRRLAAAVGFDVVDIVAQPIRDDQQQPIDGLYVHLGKPLEVGTDGALR